MAIVKLYDINEDILSNWAIENCPSFVSWLIYENSDAFADVNLDNYNKWMLRYEFEFINDQEAMLFQLRWQGQ